MALLFGLATVISSLLGGLFAIQKEDKLHLILGFSAGAVIGVAFFDLLPEAIELCAGRYDVSSVTAFIAVGFLFFMLLSRILFLHPHSTEESCDETKHQGRLGAGSLSVHSFLDGLGIGLAFQVSASVGVIVAAAVLAHDFSDGINTVGIILKHDGTKQEAFRWLLADASAPFLGVVAARFMELPQSSLGLVLSLFCGFFLYIGASDLLPESHHRHPKLITSVMTILGATVIFFAMRFAQL
jgi:ZIP family zinc transporter